MSQPEIEIPSAAPLFDGSCKFVEEITRKSSPCESAGLRINLGAGQSCHLGIDSE